MTQATRGLKNQQYIRSLAVALVDVENGITMEFAPAPSAHRAAYDEMEKRLRACMQTNRVQLIGDARPSGLHRAKAGR